MERLSGGGSTIIVPRRLRVGASFISASSGIILAFEWQGEETHKKFSFMRSSSRYGTEIPIGQYGALRSGYVAAARHRIAMGIAIGTMKEGWRVEGGWELPAATHGDTRWVVGLDYRI
jgi:hypothetical protein